MKNLTSDQPSFQEKFRRVLDSELTGTMWRFLKGGALVSAAATFGSMGAILAGVALLGLSLYRNHVITRNVKHDLLKQYKSEIASALSKDESNLSVEDVEQAAITINGGRNVISETLQKLHHNHRISDRASMIGSIITTAASAALPILVPVQFINWFGAWTAGGVVSNVMYFLAEEIAQKTGGAYKQFGSNNVVKAIHQQSKSSPVSPEQVMQVFVEAQPDLAQQIQDYFHRRYGDLSFKDKREVTARYRDIIPAKEWAEAINAGQRSATALAINAYNMAALPTDIPPLAPSPEPKLALKEPLYSFATKLDEQRSAAATKSLTLH